MIAKLGEKGKGQITYWFLKLPLRNDIDPLTFPFKFYNQLVNFKKQRTKNNKLVKIFIGIGLNL